MTIEEIRILSKTAVPLDQPAEVIETHISWILLTELFAYKIKKPVLFSFLDFSTLKKRKFYCEEELRLNQRLTNDIYLNVVPIYNRDGQFFLEQPYGNICDYAVKMKRLPGQLQMDYLLSKDLLQPFDVEKIAKQISSFHKRAEKCSIDSLPDLLFDDFEDILKQIAYIKEHIGSRSARNIVAIVSSVSAFIKQHKERINYRNLSGFVRDVHGDLHSGNIFILEEPVIFDCIEFNSHFRRIDVLNEIAFLYMDLEFHGRTDFADLLMKAYLENFNAIQVNEDLKLFHFYKLYRANVKSKINLLKAKQAKDQVTFFSRLNLAKRYIYLLEQYAASIFTYEPIDTDQPRS